MHKWQYVVLVQTEDDAYPKFLDVCDSLKKVAEEIAMVLEDVAYPNGFDTEKEQKLVFKELLKEVKKYINEKSYSKKVYEFDSKNAFSKYSSTTKEVTYEIPQVGKVVITEMMLFLFEEA